MPPRSRRNLVLVAGALVAAAASLTVLLFVPPLVGLADNGDFDRVQLPAGLRSLATTRDDRYFHWMQPRFAYGPAIADISGFRTSEAILAAAAVRFSRLGGAEQFDVRFLAAVHAALFLLAIGLLVAACADLRAAAQATAAALLVVFFTDPGYAASFSSLYSQTASFVFLLLTASAAALAIRRGRLSGATLALYFLAAALFVCSKPQESVQAVLLAPLGVRLAWRGSRRDRVAAVLLAAALAGLAWRYYASSQASSGWLTRYNVLFFEILPHSPHPERDLTELGLDPALVRFQGVTAWAPESPARDPALRAFFDARSGEPSPRGLYLRHPRRMISPLARAAKSGFQLQPRELGNYAKESGAPAFARAWGTWSSLRGRFPGAVGLLLLLGGTLAAAAATWHHAAPRGRRFRESLAVLVAMAAGAFLVAALGDWHIDLERHLYAFQAMCDLILVADAAWIVQTIALQRAGAA